MIILILKVNRYLPSFFGTQSTPNVNFLICNTKYSGKEAKREVLCRKSFQKERFQRME